MIVQTIAKLEHLMQHENYNPEDKFDLNSLQSMVQKTVGVVEKKVKSTKIRKVKVPKVAKVKIPKKQIVKAVNKVVSRKPRVKMVRP